MKHIVRNENPWIDKKKIRDLGLLDTYYFKCHLLVDISNAASITSNAEALYLEVHNMLHRNR